MLLLVVLAAISGIGLSGLFFNPWINSLLYLVTSLIAVIFGRFTLTTFGANIFAIAFIGSYSMNKVWNYFKNRNLYFGLIVSIIIGNIVSLFVIIIQSEIAYIGLEIDIIKLLLLQISLSLVEAVIVIIIFNLLSDKIKNIILNK